MAGQSHARAPARALHGGADPDRRCVTPLELLEMKELKGKVAVVTGAASGLGRAMALSFADEGMHVALGDVTDSSDVFAAVERKGVAALSMKLDVSKAAEVEAFAELID